MEFSEKDWGARVDFKLTLGAPVKLYPAVSLDVQAQWDAVDIWQRSREETNLGNESKHRQKMRSLFLFDLNFNVLIYLPRLFY